MRAGSLRRYGQRRLENRRVDAERRLLRHRSRYVAVRGRLSGPASVAETVRDRQGVVGLDIHEITAGGDRVVALLDLLLEGAPPVRVPLAETFRLRDGKVCEIRPYYYDPTPIVSAVAARKKIAGKA